MKRMEQRPEERRVPISSAVMTALFLAAIFFFCVGTLITGRDELVSSLKFHNADDYLEDRTNYTAVDLLKARIDSLDAAMVDNLYKGREFGWLSASFQYALGKRVVNIGSAQMLTLDGGYLYDMMPDCDLTEGCDEIARLKDELAGRCDFLYLYQQAATYGDVKLPEGYIDLDYSDEVADQLLSRMAQNGVEVLDTREILAASGRERSELMLRTDQHWSYLSSLLCARPLAERVQALTGVQLPLDRLDEDQFESEKFERLLYGEFGRQVGPYNAPMDDVTVYLPRYDTRILASSVKALGSEPETVEGPFGESVVQRDVLERGGYDASEMANRAYGFTEYYTSYHNEDGAPLSILMFKDSYGAPLASFLSLVARDVTMVDLRKCSDGAMRYIDEIDPDIVIVAFSQRMIYDHKYVLTTDA